MILLDTYNEEKEIEYRGERYSVRDNGSILRHPKNKDKVRKLDNFWTFGTVDKNKGYYIFSGENVHRIVACAFIKDNDNDRNLVVDHIDTNKQNNRPSNLRWVTRFDNLVLNEITRTKVELACGMPIEEVLKDMSVLHNKKLPPNIEWMRVVTQEEANQTLENWKKWVAQKQVLIEKGNFMEKMIKHVYSSQKNTSGDYPLEPKGNGIELVDYYNKLGNGQVFFKKVYNHEVVEFKIFDVAYNEKENYIAVATSIVEGIKTLYITYIRRKNDMFDYETRSFFAQESVDKYMTLARGEEWNGGDVFDDYC